MGTGLKIFHFSTTPLVGAPGRICAALASHPGVEARWGVLETSVGHYGQMVFDLDLCWQRDREEIIALARGADLLHLHNFVGLDSTQFYPIDFAALWKAGKPMVRQFHSAPSHIARILATTEATLSACPLPKLVIAQYQERFFPTARIVPNFPGAVPALSEPATGPVRIGYAPSNFTSAHRARWDTKGYPEVKRLLRQVRRAARAAGLNIEIDVIELVSHAECLARKAACEIMIDDVVTGSYHLNTLESLLMGQAVVGYLDRRIGAVLGELNGQPGLPLVNVGLEDALPVLMTLVREPELRRGLGERARAWMLEHWDARRMAVHFLDAYRAVLASPGQPFSPRFNLNDHATRWQTIDLHDLIWKERRKRWPAPTPEWFLNAKHRLGTIVRALR